MICILIIFIEIALYIDFYGDFYGVPQIKFSKNMMIAFSIIQSLEATDDEKHEPGLDCSFSTKKFLQYFGSCERLIPQNKDQ